MNKQQKKIVACPCGKSDDYQSCCGRYIGTDIPAPTPEALMRSRYSAYSFGDTKYILATWHKSTRPAALDLQLNFIQWRRLTIVVADNATKYESKGVVEFVADYKGNGKAGKLHETSRFVRERGSWYYLDGAIHESSP